MSVLVSVVPLLAPSSLVLAVEGRLPVKQASSASPREYLDLDTSFSAELHVCCLAHDPLW